MKREETVQGHLQLLGFRGQDVVTGFAGVVSSIGFDLYGCVQAVLTPSVDDKGETKDGRWFDIARIKITSHERVLDPPSFVLTEQAPVKGPAEKPVR